jgi:hypothetical protein
MTALGCGAANLRGQGPAHDREAARRWIVKGGVPCSEEEISISDFSRPRLEKWRKGQPAVGEEIDCEWRAVCQGRAYLCRRADHRLRCLPTPSRREITIGAGARAEADRRKHRQPRSRIGKSARKLCWTSRVGDAFDQIPLSSLALEAGFTLSCKAVADLAVGILIHYYT